MNKRPDPETGVRRPCENFSMKGARTCRMHGSASPQTRRKAGEQLAEATALRLFAESDFEPTGHPIEALARLGGEVTAWKEFLRDRLGDLPGLRSGGGVTPEVLLYERAKERERSVLKTIAELHIDDRLAVIYEAQAKLMETGLVWLFGQLALTAEQQRRVPALVPEMFRSLHEGTLAPRTWESPATPMRTLELGENDVNGPLSVQVRATKRALT